MGYSCCCIPVRTGVPVSGDVITRARYAAEQPGLYEIVAGWFTVKPVIRLRAVKAGKRRVHGDYGAIGRVILYQPYFTIADCWRGSTKRNMTSYAVAIYTYSGSISTAK